MTHQTSGLDDPLYNYLLPISLREPEFLIQFQPLQNRDLILSEIGLEGEWTARKANQGKSGESNAKA